MAKVERFEDLRIWHEAGSLTQWPFSMAEETSLLNDYRLHQQGNAASGSTMDNIAQGFERNSKKELIHFLSIAKGSVGECRSQLYDIRDRGFSNEQELELQLAEVLKPSKGINYLPGLAHPAGKFRNEQSDYTMPEA